jgi:hypothetical protein
MAITDNYKKELELLHSRKTFGTSSSIPKVVTDLITNKSIKSVLDYGAGKGNTSNSLKEQFPNLSVFSYDPATFPGPLPTSVELIYSSDVLEHVEPDLIEETLIDLSNRSTRYQYHLIACHPAKKSLSDGRNAHLIVEEPNWWKSRLDNIKGWTIIFEETKEYIAHVKKGPPITVVKYIVILEKIQ